jgi:regulator of replication initiation timing
MALYPQPHQDVRTVWIKLLIVGAIAGSSIGLYQVYQHHRAVTSLAHGDSRQDFSTLGKPPLPELDATQTLTSLKTEIDQLQRNNQDLKRRLKSINDQLYVEKTTAKALKSDLAKARVEINNLRSNIDKLLAENNQLATENNQLAQQSITLKSCIADADAFILSIQQMETPQRFFDFILGPNIRTATALFQTSPEGELSRLGQSAQSLVESWQSPSGNCAQAAIMSRPTGQGGMRSDATPLATTPVATPQIAPNRLSAQEWPRLSSQRAASVPWPKFSKSPKRR